MSLLFYKRPNYVQGTLPMDNSEYQKYIEKTRRAIPKELSFDMVVSNRAMPPCSLQDFIGYLINVSHDAENLQFYLWLQDYKRRFYASSGREQALSPPWDEESLPQPSAISLDANLRRSERTLAKTADYNINFESKETRFSPISDGQSLMSGHGVNSTKAVADANAQTGLKWQAFTIQPFRSEINRVITHYLVPGAPRELNLSQKHRTACLHALQHTTHPSAFSIPATIVTRSLRQYSHPNFIRWATLNANQPRMIFGRVLGAVHILFGFAIAILLTLSHKPRWWRISAAFAWFLGFSFLLAGSNGICLVLYVTHDRHLRPWEQYASDSESSFSADDSDKTTLASSDALSMSQLGGAKKRQVALEAFGTANSYGSGIWVEKYRAKMMIRKIFDKTVWVENESVRLMQDKVALQALIWSVFVTVPLTILFTALPKGHFY